MKISKQGCILVIAFASILGISMYILGSSKDKDIDTVNINDYAKTIEEGADEQVIEQLGKEYGLSHYYQNGQLIVYSNGATDVKRVRHYAMLVVVFVVLMSGAIIAYHLYIVNRTITKPFHKLQDFALAVAGGDLNAPLKMDKENVFGAFTESFDIMREELAIAKENERKANESKKELVANLSHDIKTPLASIKAMTELLLVNKDERLLKDKLRNIDQKTEQIEGLVNNLFHATLEELEELQVSKEEVSSLHLLSLLTNADSSQRLTKIEIPECLVICDPLRLQQVFDNIISNSYKYADSKITFSTLVAYGYLHIILEDYGTAIPSEELPFLTQKYYRGQNSEGKNGAGIGLYISNYFMEKMDGFLRVENGEHGFKVTVGVKLV